MPWRTPLDTWRGSDIDTPHFTLMAWCAYQWDSVWTRYPETPIWLDFKDIFSWFTRSKAFEASIKHRLPVCIMVRSSYGTRVVFILRPSVWINDITSFIHSHSHTAGCQPAYQEQLAVVVSGLKDTFDRNSPGSGIEPTTLQLHPGHCAYHLHYTQRLTKRLCSHLFISFQQWTTPAERKTPAGPYQAFWLLFVSPDRKHGWHLGS